MTKPLSSYVHPIYGDWLLDVQRPARYVGGELGATPKPDAPIQIALAFPDLYEIGMSHLGLRILYQVVNGHPDMAAERVFMPWPDMEEQLRRRRLPLVTMETAKPLGAFPIVGFSLQYELTYTNLLAMLDLGGIPLRSTQRGEEHPIVLAGGPVATHAEPIAPFVDVFMIGEAEAAISEILHKEAEARQEGLNREERIRLLDSLPYCYAPAMHPVVEDPVTGRLVVDSEQPLAKRAWIENLASWPSPAGGPVPSVEAVFDRISLEIMRGCTQGCRFCQAGVLYRPVRELDAEQVAAALGRAIEETGWDEASLTGLSPADHSHLLEVFHRAAEQAAAADVSLTVSSLRAYGLSEQFLDDLRTGRGGGLTFAPEAGTQRMRDLVNKNVSADDLVATAREVSKRGWNRIKLYFMLGLPTETDEDLRAIVDLGWEVRKAAKHAAPRKTPTVTCSLSTFVPKPHTPFQWEPMIDLDEILRRQSVVRKAAAGSPVRLRFHEPHTSLLEGILCRGDRKLAAVVEKAYLAGARFDGWEEHLRWDIWLQALESEGLSPATYMEGLPEDGRLPWDHIDVGVRRAFLIRERRKALQAEPTAPCGQPDPKRPGRILCHGCGAPCDLEALAERYARDSAPTAARSVRKEPLVAPTGAADAVRIRLRYSKTGPAVLWGHLSLVRHLPRTLRRSGLRPAYSGGFHPKPKIAYAPPLPVGWAGSNELADVFLEPEGIFADRRILGREAGPLDPDTLDEAALGALIERMNPVAPPGLAILAMRVMGPQEPALGRVLAAETYRVSIPGLSRDRALEGLERFRTDLNLFVTKTSKSGKERRLLLREHVLALALDEEHPDESASTVTMTLTTGQGISPLMVCDLLFDAGTAKVLRTGFLDNQGGDPFLAPSPKQAR